MVVDPGWILSGMLAVAVVVLLARDRHHVQQLRDANQRVGAQELSDAAYQRGRIDATRDANRARMASAKEAGPLPEQQLPPVYVPPPIPWQGDRWGRP